MSNKPTPSEIRFQLIKRADEIINYALSRPLMLSMQIPLYCREHVFDTIDVVNANPFPPHVHSTSVDLTDIRGMFELVRDRFRADTKRIEMVENDRLFLRDVNITLRERVLTLEDEVRSLRGLSAGKMSNVDV